MRISGARRSRGGFTLIELLIVISILVIVAALIAAGSWAVIGNTQAKATKVVLDQLQSALDARIDQFMKDTKSSQPIATYGVFVGSASPAPNSVDGRRAAVIARLDAMRSAFPQYFYEIVPSELFVGLPPNTNPFAAFIATLPPPYTKLATAPITNPYPTHQTLLLNYSLDSQQIQTRAQFAGAVWAAQNISATPANHDPATESAECLYLILSDNTTGDDVISQIPSRFIKDTDQDGLKEFVDGWGRPIRYYRWPTDTYAYFVDASQRLPASYGRNSLDPDGLLYDVNWWGTLGTARYFLESITARFHSAYNFNPGVLVSDLRIASDQIDGRNLDGTFGTQPRQYPFRPLLVSAGSDGEFGMYDVNTHASNGSGTPFTPPLPMPHLHIGIRCGRVEELPEREEKLRDNIFSIELQEGIRR